MNHKSHISSLSTALYVALISLSLLFGCSPASSAGGATADSTQIAVDQIRDNHSTASKRSSDSDESTMVQSAYDENPVIDQQTRQNNSTPGASTEKSILIFGDSLSAAYRMDENQGWVALLSNRIEHKQLPYEVINASVSGETTTGGLARLPAVLAANAPEIVVLELGGNDGLRGMPVSSIRDNLLQMIELIESSGATAVLAGIQIPPNYGPRYTEPFTRLFEEIAAERELVFIPFLIDGIPQDPELMQDDGIHPRAEAQTLVLNNVWPFLEDLLQQR
jgi:acyl-CoA thioesterase-1